MLLPSLNPVQLALAAFSCWLLKLSVEKVFSIRRALKTMGDCPGGEIIWLHPFRSAAAVVAPFFPLSGWIGHFYGKFSAYTKYRSTCLATVHFWSAVPSLWLSDAEAIKVVLNDRVVFRRDLPGYEVVSVYGPNMVATEGPIWKRHRAVAKPAFNEANNAFLWLQTTRIVNEWFSHIEASKGNKLIKIDTLKDITQVALHILSSTAFGRDSETPWNEDSTSYPSSDAKNSFASVVLTAMHNLIPLVLTPSWLPKLVQYIPIPFVGPFVKETRESFEVLKVHMYDLITLARTWATGDKSAAMDAALLRNLVEANLAQEDDALQKSLTDQELLSNTFMFLLAGHETSAHSLCFAIAHLALYPDIQKKVFDEVERLWPEGVPTMEATDPMAYRESLANLEYTTAAFQETLRLFPPVPRLAKPVHNDATLTVRRFETSPEGKLGSVMPFQLSVPAGALMIIDIIAVHLNPIHWGDDAEVFKPERFIDTDSYRWPRDAFMAFSTGPRSCIGERFAMTESVCVLANIVRKYEILLPDELKSRSPDERRKLLLDWVPRLTLTPQNAKVVFRSRY